MTSERKKEQKAKTVSYEPQIRQRAASKPSLRQTLKEAQEKAQPTLRQKVQLEEGKPKKKKE